MASEKKALRYIGTSYLEERDEARDGTRNRHRLPGGAQPHLSTRGLRLYPSFSIFTAWIKILERSSRQLPGAD
jgi:hypothetical protein